MLCEDIFLKKKGFCKKKVCMYIKKVRPQSRESREIFGETETRKMVPRRDQSRGLESRLQPLVPTIREVGRES